MLVMGVSAPSLPVIIKHYIKSCQGCLHYNLFFSAKTPFSRALKESSGPNDSLDSCLNNNPLSFLIVDELGPIFYENPNDKANYLTAHLIIGVELITARVHIVPINDMSILSIVQGLEILQNHRGCLINLVFDAHKSHIALTRQEENDSRVELFRLI